jgi:hypothetical protein
MSDSEGTALAANLEKLITGDMGRLMKSLSQEMKIFGTPVEKMVSKDGSDI